MLMCSTWVALDNHHRREALLLLGLPVTLSPLDPWLPDVTPALGCPPSMADTIFSSGNDQWVCPNDRQLALRAKLQTGWSVHTYQTEKQRRSQCLSPEELEVILQVIQRAERLDILEQQRIGRLVERLETMQRNVLGNGLSQCLLCGEVLGFLGSSSVFCKDCRKKLFSLSPSGRDSVMCSDQHGTPLCCLPGSGTLSFLASPWFCWSPSSHSLEILPHLSHCFNLGALSLY
ncbi:rab effector Noc2 isoform X10 [Meriones unguiculatus]|uniref:rab effector Noc2 isoform X10 n=1 Tax=Meriones unguiculatus TaxID=10047 RepID=UPI00293F0DB0|nr:rab effector Noc2 isoform X10 [Meriones unguiculatus]